MSVNGSVFLFLMLLQKRIIKHHHRTPYTKKISVAHMNRYASCITQFQTYKNSKVENLGGKSKEVAITVEIQIIHTFENLPSLVLPHFQEFLEQL